MLLPGRDTWDPQYRFGFNGKENELDFRGVGQITDYGARIYNARLGKFLSVDPLSKNYPWYSPYQYAGNNPIYAIDLDGLEPYPSASNENAVQNTLRNFSPGGMWIPNNFGGIIDRATNSGGSNFKYGAWWRLAHGIGGTKRSGAIGVVGEAYAAAGEFSPMQGLSANMFGQNGTATLSFPNTQPRLRTETSDFIISYTAFRNHSATLYASWANGQSREVEFNFKANKSYEMYYEVKTISENRNSPGRIYEQIEGGFNQILNNIANSKVGTIHILYVDKEAYMKAYNNEEYKLKLNKLFSRLEQQGGGSGFLVLKENFYRTVESAVNGISEKIKENTDTKGNDGKTY